MKKNPFIPIADENSTAVFAMFCSWDQSPLTTNTALFYQTQPESMVIVPFGKSELRVTEYTIEADIKALQKDLRYKKSKLSLVPR